MTEWLRGKIFSNSYTRLSFLHLSYTDIDDEKPVSGMLMYDPEYLVAEESHLKNLLEKAQADGEKLWTGRIIPDDSEYGLNSEKPLKVMVGEYPPYLLQAFKGANARMGYPFYEEPSFLEVVRGCLLKIKRCVKIREAS